MKPTTTKIKPRVDEFANTSKRKYNSQAMNKVKRLKRKKKIQDMAYQQHDYSIEKGSKPSLTQQQVGHQIPDLSLADM